MLAVIIPVSASGYDASPSCNCVWIYYPDGSTKTYTDIGDSLDITIDTPGSYEALVQAWNAIGAKSSDRIKFHVGPPSGLWISTNKSQFSIGETVSFSFDSSVSSNIRDLFIYYPDGTQEVFCNQGTSFSKSFSVPGDYYALMQAWNDVGSSACTDKIKFTIIPSTPFLESAVQTSGVNHIIKVSFYNHSSSCCILLTGYKSKRLVVSKIISYNGSSLSDSLAGDIDEIKVMAWDSLGALTPLCEAETILESEFITE